MTNRYRQPGVVIDYTNSTGSTIAGGTVVVIGARVGVVLKDIAAGATGSLQVKQVFVLDKKSGDTFVQGALAYWDATNKYITSTATSNTLAGYATVAAASADTSVWVALNA